VAADAGYWSEEDLTYAADHRDRVDVLIAQRKESRRCDEAEQPYFGAGQFDLGPDRVMTCPAGTKMEGPFRDGDKLRYHGVGCDVCPLKPRCTRGKRRILTMKPQYQALQQEMTARMKRPDAAARYNQRIATVEPVFAQLQDGMAFRRVSSRQERAILAELMLKVLAYNLGRLLAARRLRRIPLLLAFSSTL
jgi:hypothetical protein